MKPPFSIRRRALLGSGLAASCAGLLAACANAQAPAAVAGLAAANTRLRFFSPSGYLGNSERVDIGTRRLHAAGFVLDNTAALHRRHQRFAGTDAERAADLQDVASGRAATPKLFLGTRGGYGAMRLLPLVDWASLASRMREAGTVMVGYSDVCAVQLALLARSQLGSFAGPMLYSEFGNPDPSTFTLQSFIDTLSRRHATVQVPTATERQLDISGVLWGGNLSVLASLAGSPWLPQVPGGMVFLEDVGEQPYRLERMLQTLYLAGVFKRQQAVVLGTFRMSQVRDGYDESYDFGSVIATLRRLTGLPVLTGFPSGHIRDKVTLPLGFPARLRSTPQGYSVHVQDYPTLNANAMNLPALLEQYNAPANTEAASPGFAVRGRDNED